ncbi:glycine/sarcosine/betaine reductase selenoprotein B family protein [Paenisporosarcina sp. TG20]|uniref:glycine/sarcosine/betaine reductase selenoprotein B family protein n=1 Tax=Paenisporosarcina sp. TG20 TaxID=1211706 RepID=UPI00036D92EB|nr:glycine/sarcosine/betaine reductase selenoprotein B family protein [Paenisporosarcina sp. TG20]
MTETSKPNQLRLEVWNTVNERYPGSMISKEDFVPLSFLTKPLSESKLSFVSTSGVQPVGTMPFDTVHPIGDYTYREVPSNLKPHELEIHQLKYPTVGANQDINVIFPIERLQELAQEGVIGGLTDNFYSFIGYNMDPDKLEQKLAEDIADAVVKSGADIALLCPA